jgi:catechol-2,3-dioxygenase
VQHAAFSVASEAALSAMKAHLEASGVDVLGPVDHGFVRSIYFFDPNGLRLELTTPTASPQELADFERDAHSQLSAWTAEKSALA